MPKKFHVGPHCNHINLCIISVTSLYVLGTDGAKWVDANIRARESVERRRQINFLARRSLDEIDMSVDELLQLTKG